MHVLVVEDHAHTAQLIADALRRAGFTVDIVDSAEEAHVRLNQRPTACVVMDHRLPLQDGLHAIRVIREQHPSIQIVFISETLDLVLTREALRAGAFRCLEKRGTYLVKLVALVKEAVSDIHPRSDDRGIQPGIVGRDQELIRLAQALDDARQGKGRIVFVRGDEGLGKTTLARTAATLARDRGMLTLTACCDPGRSAYAPWFHIYRAYIEHTRRPTPIDELIAELEREFETLDVGSDQAQIIKERRFARVAAFLEGIATDQPVLIILDDLQLADSASVEFFGYVAGRAPGHRIVILGAYRPNGAPIERGLVASLDRIAKDHEAAVLTLQPFTVDEVQTYLERAFKCRIAPDVAGALFEKCNGHPRTLAEMVHLIRAENPTMTTPQLHHVAGLAASETSTINRRLQHLGPDSLHWVAVMALCGSEFDERLLLDVAGDDAPLATAALEEARRHRIIAETERSGLFAFCSEPLRDAAIEHLTRSARSKWHEAIGRGIESRYSRNLGPWLSTIARHLMKSNDDGVAAEGIEYACRAGDRSGGLIAWREAAAIFEEALRLDARISVLSRAQRLSVLNRLAEALWRCGDFSEGRRAGRRALNEADPSDDPDAYLRTLLNFAGLIPGYGTIVKEPAVAAALEEGLLRTSGMTCTLRPLVKVRLADEYAFSEQAPRAGTLVEEARREAAAMGNLELEVAVFRQSQWTMWVETPAKRRATMEAMLRLAEKAQDISFKVDTVLMHVLCAIERGDIPTARRVLARCIITANELRLPYGLWLAKVIAACLDISTGRFPEGLQHSGDSVAFGQACANPNATLFNAVQVGHVYWHQGYIGPLLEWLDFVGRQVPALALTVRLSRGIALCEVGRFDEARAIVNDLGPNPLSGLPRDVTWAMNVVYIGEIAARTGLKHVARSALALLRTMDTHQVMLPPLFSLAPLPHYLGVLEGALGNSQSAITCLDKALLMERQAEAPHWEARTLIEKAQLLARRHKLRDARKCLDAARPTIEQLGLKTLEDRAREIETACVPPPEKGRMMHRCKNEVLDNCVRITLDDGPPVDLDRIDGLLYLLELIRNAGVLIEAVLLYARVKGPISSANGRLDGGMTKAAREKLSADLHDLRERRQEAEDRRDFEEIAKLDQELARLMKIHNLASTPRDRKAEMCVRKAIGTAIKKIMEADPRLLPLAEFLDDDHTILMGQNFVFFSRPDWIFEV